METKLDRESPFFIAGASGMVGSAMKRYLESLGFSNILSPASSELNLLDRDSVFEYILKKRPKYAVIAAAKVGGIMANDSFSADFISENLLIQVNVLDACNKAGVQKLAFLGSSCIYPKFCPQPIREEYLLTGLLEPTNESYAIAKIAGIKQVQAIRKQFGHNWISVQPCNLYGPGDNYTLNTSHVIPALIRRYLQGALEGSKSVTNWGSGKPLREFLYVDDLAKALLFLLENYDSPIPINVGAGTDLPIWKVAELISEFSEFEGETLWDDSKPDGTPRKLLDISKIQNLGWTPETDLVDGLRSTVALAREMLQLTNQKYS
jgi:GDP-L-fucose synthase